MSASIEGEAFRFQVSDTESGERIDRILVQRLEHLGRKLAGKLCDAGLVRVNGKRVRKSRLVYPGDEVIVERHSWGQANAAPDLELRVVLERPDLIVVDKAAGVPSTALVGKEQGTLAGALLARYPDLKDVGYGPREPGLLHRLDNYTSGLVLAARDTQTFNRLHEALISGNITKRYLALVPHGVLPAEGTRTSGLAPDPHDRRRVIEADARRSFTTQFRVIRQQAEIDLVEVSVSTAYRHQIRVHLSALGAPLLGDQLYGSQHVGLSPRHALHASYIAAAASEVPAFEATSELPEDLAALFAPS